MKKYRELIAENHYGAHTPEVVAEWLLANGATCESSLVTTEKLRALAAGELEGEAWSSVVEDLYTWALVIDGQRFRLVLDSDEAVYLEEV